MRDVDAIGPRKPRLLAVDDNLDSADLIVRVACGCGYDAQSLTDIQPLRHLISMWRPEIVTLDLGMPQEDGIAVLSRIKSSGFAGSLIIVSGQDRGLRQAAQRLAAAQGINVIGDMQKPVDIKELRKLLADFAHSTAAFAPSS